MNVRKRNVIYGDESTALISLLRDFRAKAGMTQASLAAQLGCSQGAISKLENGQRMLGYIELRSICRLFRVSIAEFDAALSFKVSRQNTRRTNR